jgi:superoxide oxidase
MTRQCKRLSAHVDDRTPSALIKALHWLTFFLIVAVLASAALIRQIPNGWRSTVIQLHRSVGLTIWIATLSRLVWLQFSKLPDWPPNMSPIMRGAAQSVEYLLYTLLLLQPILGFVHSIADGGRVKPFFVFRLPQLMRPNDELAEQLLTAHRMIAATLFATLALHVSAAPVSSFYPSRQYFE